MFVSAFRHLMASLFRGIGIEPPTPHALPNDGTDGLVPSSPSARPYGIPDELAERRLPPGPILPQPVSPGD
jgi:hypothetical protein